MRIHVLGGLMVLLAAAPVSAQEKNEEPSLTAAQVKYRAVIKDYTAARQELIKKYQAAATADKESLQGQISALAGKFGDRFFKIAQEHPEDPGAEDALAFLSAQIGANAQTDALGVKAFAMLVTNFPESKKLRQGIAKAKYSTSPALQKPLRKIMERHPDLEVQSQACLALAEYLRGRFEKDYQQKKSGDAALLKQAEELLIVGQTRFAETKNAKQFEEAVFTLANLTVGKHPPEITGEDLDGKPFKLSDYRGKVVVIDFWGDW